ncbi:SDR family oxidoreductase [Leptospira biflexa]|uniref:SDR family oxidoreductase n=1 Tax=Leptospira biflexa TaxID=172 RepID=UPI001083BE5C|nr:SDR family oxidoreductase [Leptospira biflexa]TGM32136.1 SDR family oxidoreductase [Leptospira biflexa]TGM42114.1 SDR family oxidoreductase [Leptospira biflexa]TGM42640.1 SDR family oxidoreductase [Leptospira biflexa]TGM45718.1 SDR family oxidoreductase [Leptospira biflexa]TGM51877.1 SDR family oxidoreductase [Leptospira biflexa]
MTQTKHVHIFGIGSGIGKGLYDRFLQDPTVSLFGFSRKGEHPLNTFSKGEAGTFQFDATDQKDLRSFELSLAGMFGHNVIPSAPFYNRPELVVYFALGDGIFGPIDLLKKKELESHFQLNVHSLILLSKFYSHHIPFFPNKATFVFLGSTAGKQGFSESVTYCASKHAVLGITRALREEWKPFGTKVVHVSLGAVATEIWDSRPEFDKNEMVSISDISEYLWSISQLPKSIFVDDLSITPKKGIL